jgi:hypothetical protein
MAVAWSRAVESASTSHISAGGRRASLLRARSRHTMPATAPRMISLAGRGPRPSMMHGSEPFPSGAGRCAPHGPAASTPGRPAAAHVSMATLARSGPVLPDGGGVWPLGLTTRPARRDRLVPLPACPMGARYVRHSGWGPYALLCGTFGPAGGLHKGVRVEATTGSRHQRAHQSPRTGAAVRWLC